jgi:hypothetical protein
MPECHEKLFEISSVYLRPLSFKISVAEAMTAAVTKPWWVVLPG